jgi:hypothetical protein
MKQHVQARSFENNFITSPKGPMQSVEEFVMRFPTSLFRFVVFALLASASALIAQESKALVDLLIKKGVLT